MRDMSSREAAEALGVNEQRLRALAAAGRVPARKVGRAWIIDSARLPGPADRRGPGRPLSAANAWALLALLCGENPAWVDPSVRSRLRRRAEDPALLVASLRGSEPRAHIYRFRCLPHDLADLSSGAGLVLTGLSADDPVMDMRARPDELDAYVGEDELDRIVERYRPILEPDRVNVLLRVPSRSWILGRDAPSPSPVAAADLLSSEDPRVRRSAEEALHALLA